MYKYIKEYIHIFSVEILKYKTQTHESTCLFEWSCKFYYCISLSIRLLWFGVAYLTKRIKYSFKNSFILFQFSLLIN